MLPGPFFVAVVVHAFSDRLIQHVSFTARTTGFEVAVLAFDGWVSYLGIFGADDAIHDV